jgi:hypothetical protein
MVTFVTIAQDDREGWRGDASERSRRVTKRRRAAFRLRSGQAALQKAGGKFGTGERVVRDPPISGTGVHTADFDCCTQNDKVKPRNSRSLTPVARRDWVRDDKRKAKPRNFAPFLNLRYKNHQSHPSQTALRQKRRSKLRSGCGTPVEFPARRNPGLRDHRWDSKNRRWGTRKSTFKGNADSCRGRQASSRRTLLRMTTKNQQVQTHDKGKCRFPAYGGQARWMLVASLPAAGRRSE